MASSDLAQALLEQIIGEQLGSVIFVADYLQLDFNGSVLTAFSPPTVHIQEQTLTWGESGYRDAVCAQILHEVISVKIDYAEFIKVKFDTSAAFCISLKDDPQTVEAAMFRTFDGDWWVIRPGESKPAGGEWFVIQHGESGAR